METSSSSGGANEEPEEQPEEVSKKTLDKHADLKRCLDEGLITRDEYEKLHASLQAGHGDGLKKDTRNDDTKEERGSMGKIELKRADLRCAKDNGLISDTEYMELLQGLGTHEMDVKRADLHHACSLGLISPSEHDAIRAQLVARPSGRSDKEKNVKLADLLSARQVGLITAEEYDRIRQQLNAEDNGHNATSAYTRGFEGGASAGFQRGFDSSGITSPLVTTSSSAGDETFIAGYEAGFVEGFNRGLTLRLQQRR
mmetsp:Transcript_30808/g.57448  ORF Transcript_30808/g.57448 Transcript_30808/m.57448 type:complete len:256 (-) Transcript_30808:50-817(-)